MGESGFWRSDLGALAFVPAHHDGWCFVHRLAFRTLKAGAGMPADCENYFQCHRAAFEAAAARKIEQRRLAPAANFHLTSRDIKRAMTP